MESVIEDMIYVAVGNKMKEGKLVLLWALQNSGGRRICVLHVHQPSQFIPFMGTNVLAYTLKDEIVKDHRRTERKKMNELLDKYILFCRQTGVQAQKLVIETDHIGDGIVELISQYKIKKLVMGAASRKKYKRNMIDVSSDKAKYVREKAPPFCRIQFICKDRLIFTRDAQATTETVPSSHMVSRSVTSTPNRPSNEILLPNSLRSQTIPIYTTKRDSNGRSIFDNSLRAGAGESPYHRSRLDVEMSSDESEGLSRSGSGWSTSSSRITAERTKSLSNESNENWLQFNSPSPPSSYSRSPAREVPSSLPPPSPILFPSAGAISRSCNGAPSAVDGSLDVNTHHAKLQEAMAEAAQEMLRHQKAKGDLNEALYRAQKEQIQRKTEEALAKERELENVKIQRDKLMEVLRFSKEQELSLKNQIAELQKANYELRVERDNVRKEANGLSRKGGGSAEDIPQFFEFSLSDIEEATQGFNESRKIGEGGYGSIYKGILHQTHVAIKRLHPHQVHSDAAQGPSEFQMEVYVLSQLRHPNLVKLIGSCPEAFALIYEYVPNGSLEDRLSCKNNSLPLSWQTRIRIATELCSVLIYLHSIEPCSIVHGDLKPSNILLGGNFESKLSDFGISRLLSPDKGLTNETLSHTTVPKGTLAYIDPEFLETGVLTLKSDVYSFGVILLQLLTGKAAFSIANKVKDYLDTGNLKSILDPLAGEWPITCAQELARLGLRCCDRKRKRRPELRPDVWKVLESMNALIAASSSSQLHLEY